MLVLLPLVAAAEIPRLPVGGGPDPELVRRDYIDAGWTASEATRWVAARDTRMDFLGSMGTVPIANMQTDGKMLSGKAVTQQGMPPNITRVLDPSAGVPRQLVRIELAPQDQRTARSWRTQVADAPLRPYRRYAWVLVFKLDTNWNINLPKQRGLFWQVLGHPKPGQHGNPVIAFNLEHDQLYCSILYPESALHRQPGAPVRWKQNQYVKVPLPRRTIEPGRFHTLQLEMFTDDRADGEGFFKAILDGQSWIDYVGPTLHPDQSGPHLPAWGWYQWDGPVTESRVIWWAVNQRYMR